MAENFGIFRDPSGGFRLRSVKAGYHPTDLAVPPQAVTFDSAWLNSFRVRLSGVAAPGVLGASAKSYFGGGGTRTVAVLSDPALAGANGPGRPTLAWQRNGGGSIDIAPTGSSTITSQSYARGYGTCGVTLHNDEIWLSPYKAGHEYVYFVFEVNPQGFEASGGGGGVLGNHPLYGPGIFISRPGVNPLTASLDDMTLSTRKHHFQIAETGLSGAPTHNVSGDPFPNSLYIPAQARSGFLINLAGSYPNYPPVIAYPADYASGSVGSSNTNRQPVSIFWLSPSQIMVAHNNGDAPVRYAIIASDPDYVPGTGALVRRVVGIKGQGLYVTKKGVDFYSAGANDFLFRSDRQSPRFTGFDDVPTGSPGITTWSLPNPPASGGPPFAFIVVNDGQATNNGWWCGCGFMMMQDIIRATTGPDGSYHYGPIISALVAGRTQFKTYRDPDTGYPTGQYGKIATMNVSDF